MAKVIKMQNSIAIEIPQTIQDKTGIKVGDHVKIEMTEHGNICIRLHRNETNHRRQCLNELLSRVTAENLHKATDWGHPVGGEVW